MTPDYDLSNLAYSEADLWLSLHADAIRVRILLDQAARRASDSRRGDASRVVHKRRLGGPRGPAVSQFGQDR